MAHSGPGAGQLDLPKTGEKAIRKARVAFSENSATQINCFSILLREKNLKHYCPLFAFFFCSY